MDNAYLLALYAEIEAVKVECYGMLALNAEREAQDYAQAYDEVAFLAKAQELRKLSERILSLRST